MITHPVVIEGNLELFVGVYVDVVIVLGLLWRRPNKPPYGQVVNEQLIPTMGHKRSDLDASKGNLLPKKTEQRRMQRCAPVVLAHCIGERSNL